jgi:hypothetical protein
LEAILLDEEYINMGDLEDFLSASARQSYLLTA